MNKNQESEYDRFVKKLSQKTIRIVKKSDLLDSWRSSGWSDRRILHAISRAIGEGRLSSLAQGYYLVTIPDLVIDLDDSYWSLISILIRERAHGRAIIGGEKSLELALKDYSPPEVLILYTRGVEARIRLFSGREVHLRTISSGAKSGRLDLFSRLWIDREHRVVGGVSISTLSLEASLLDTASIKHHEGGVHEDLLRRGLRQYGSRLSRESLEKLVALRWIRGANRLRLLARQFWFLDLSKLFISVIRSSGGWCYLSERSVMGKG